jgi:hypothetical protein
MCLATTVTELPGSLASNIAVVKPDTPALFDPLLAQDHDEIWHQACKVAN